MKKNEIEMKNTKNRKSKILYLTIKAYIFWVKEKNKVY